MFDAKQQCHVASDPTRRQLSWLLHLQQSHGDIGSARVLRSILPHRPCLDLKLENRRVRSTNLLRSRDRSKHGMFCATHTWAASAQKSNGDAHDFVAASHLWMLFWLVRAYVSTLASRLKSNSCAPGRSRASTSFHKHVSSSYWEHARRNYCEVYVVCPTKKVAPC